MFSSSVHPSEPIDLVKEPDLELTVLDKVMSIGNYEEPAIPCVGHDEEPGGHIEVEGDVHHDNQHAAHLQTNSVLHCFFVLKY